MTPRLCHSVPAIVLLASLMLGMFTPYVQAEITVDGSLGSPSGPVGKVENNYLITEDLGRLSGNNLFHSFGQFNLSNGESATFTGPSPVENILSRVTGGSTSHIDGTIQSTYPGANLYLINPFGIMLGPNARLDVKGSFHATTADYIGHSDGMSFNAVPTSGEVLSFAPPAAFGFLGTNHTPISVQESQLEVPTGNTLSLIGGDIDINRSNVDDSTTIVAPSGRVNIASVASPGEVIPQTADLEMNGFDQLGRLSVQTPNAEGTFDVIDTEGDPGGSVFIRSGSFIMQDAAITSATRGVQDHPGTGVDVNVKGEMRLERSEIASSSFGDGRAGNIKIAAEGLELVGDPLSVSDAFPFGHNSNIGSRAFAAGDAGDLEIASERLVIRNNAFINSNALGSGTGGDIRIATGSLEVLGEDSIAFVSTISTSGGTGDGGNLEITADNILLHSRGGFTGLTTQVNETGLGNAGNISINTGRLEVLDGAEISTAVFNGPGDAGDLVITADTFLVDGVNSNDINASISSSVFWNQNGSTTGDGGDLHITARDLQVTDKGSITTRNSSNGPGDAGTIVIDTETLEVSGGAFLSSERLAFGTGRAGDININARDVRVAGPSPEGWPTGIFTLASVAASAAGDVNIAADSLQLVDGAQINSRTFGPGAGGTVNITADKVLIGGADPQTGDPARIDARTLAFQGFEDNATGRGGNIRISARVLDLHDAGKITTASSSAGDGGDIALDVTRLNLRNGTSISAESTSTGDAGSILINAGESVHLLDNSSVSTEAEFSGGGKITINTRDLLYLLRSRITSSVADGSGNGGDITIDPVFVVLDHSQILANAFAGAGGNIDITTDFFFASPDSILDASSQLGINGRIVIRSAATNNIAGLSSLPASFLDATVLLRERCAASVSSTASSFVVSGRGGLPPSPEEPLASASIAMALPKPDKTSSAAAIEHTGRPVLLPVSLAGHPALVLGCGH